jgi:tetratricopeptide (TPR) repeat protein
MELRSMATRIRIHVAVALLGVAAAASADWDAGVTAFKAKNYAQAQKEFETVVRERPDWSGGYLMLGRTQLLSQRVNESIATLRKAYDLGPSDLEIQLALAQAYLTGNRAAEASQLLTKVNAASVPKERQAHFQQLQAKAAAESGQSDRAAAALERAASSNPNDASVQYNYGVAALNAGNLAAAVGALEKSVRLDPNDADKQKLLVQAMVRQGRESSNAGKDAIYARAAEIARSLSAKAPTFDNWLLLGETQLGAGQYDAAIASFAQASSKNANDWLPHFYAGQAQTALAQYREAEGSLRRALERSSAANDKARVWRQIGFVYEKQKNFDQAKVAYRSAGDGNSVARIEENEKIAQNNAAADAEAAKVAELKAQQEKLRKQIEQQQGAPPPPR